MVDFYDKAMSFAEEHIAPIAREISGSDEFPTSLYDKIKENDFLKLTVPTELGGLGGDIHDHAEVVRAFSKHSASVGLTYMMHNVALNIVLNSAKDTMKEKIVKEVIEEGKLLALAYSESGSGVNFYYPETTAKKEGDVWVINGKKSMVTSSGYATYYMVITKTGEARDATDNFIVPINTEGIDIQSDKWNGIGVKANVSAPIKFDQVKLSDDYRTGEPGTGMLQILTLVAPMFLAGLAAVYSGINMAICDEAIMHATDRTFPDGSKLSEVDCIKNHISQIYNNSFASVSATQAATLSARNGDDDALAKILSARIIAIENAIESGTLGMRIGGGRAYSQFRNFSNFLADALAGQVMAPSLDILHQWVGSVLTGQQIP